MQLISHTGSTRRALAVTSHWLPRVIAGAFAVVCLVQGVLTWMDAPNTVERASAVGRFLLPGLLAIAVLLISRQSSRIAAALCVAVAMLYAVLPDARLGWIVRVAAPLLAEAALFVLDSRIHRHAHRPARPRLSHS